MNARRQLIALACFAGVLASTAQAQTK